MKRAEHHHLDAHRKRGVPLPASFVTNRAAVRIEPSTHLLAEEGFVDSLLLLDPWAVLRALRSVTRGRADWSQEAGARYTLRMQLRLAMKPQKARWLPSEGWALMAAARERIRKGKRWTKGALARNAQGASVDPTSEAATCWSAQGGILAENTDFDPALSVQVVAMLAVEPLLTQRIPVSAFGMTFEQMIADFNDAPERLHPEIQTLFLRAQQLEPTDPLREPG